MDSKEKRLFGRRPKHDDFDDLESDEDRILRFQDESIKDDDDEDEEVNLDKPDFQKGEMWSDYADDLEFEE